MLPQIEYKGYSTRLEYSTEGCIFCGKILEISNLTENGRVAAKMVACEEKI